MGRLGRSVPVFRLTTVALLVKDADTAVEDVDRAKIVPAVLEIHLTHIRLVQETVAVVIVVSPVVLVVTENLRVHLTQMDVTIGVGLQFALRIAVDVEDWL